MFNLSLKWKRLLLTWVSVIFVLFFSVNSFAFTKGLYLTAWTAMISKQMDSLIAQAKPLGIDTFVIDVEQPHKAYAANIAKVKAAGLNYVARIVVFPDGGTADQVKSQAYWEKRWKQAQYAISLGANAIQLDYIRYKHTNKPSDQNAQDIHEVIKYFRKNMASTPNVKLQMDVFGIASHMHSRYIGQDVLLFAKTIDSLNPMVYPSHYEPFRYHSERPYETITWSLKAIKDRLKNDPNVQVIAYIEMYNFRFPMSERKRIDYIVTEMQAARDAGANGWYAWSANNKYALLFEALKHGGTVMKVKNASMSAKKDAKAPPADSTAGNTKSNDAKTTSNNQSASNSVTVTPRKRCFPGMKCN